MRLDDLLAGLGPATVEGDASIDVRGVALDSRTVRPGDLFFALAGRRDDGRRHVRAAVDRGACAVVAATAVEGSAVPRVRVADPRRLLGHVAARLAGDPSRHLTVVGVTGTNGKTTTTYLLEAIWRAAGLRPGVIGTIAYRHAGSERPAPFTTPEAPELQACLAEMQTAGTTHVAMEVSSHALALDRVAGCRFDAAVFTNLTRDHLDFHGTLEAYYEAKERLFREHLPAGEKPDPVAVVNVDDARGQELARAIGGRCVTVGRAAGAVVRPLDLQVTLDGTHGTLVLGRERCAFRTALVGAPHAENVMAAAATAWALGVGVDAIAAGIAAAAPPPGRTERIRGRGFTVVVDYAHSPDALTRLLEALRPLTAGRLVTVFGCGGDRDRGKRPLMGEAAARLADVLVLTSDNPRSEDPRRILAEIEAGVQRAGMAPRARASAARGYLIEEDRRRAIHLAIELARAGDLVVVAGKGHEDYQIVGTEKRRFDDREEVRAALSAELGESGHAG